MSSDLADHLQHAAEYGEATKELMLEAAKIVREHEATLDRAEERVKELQEATSDMADNAQELAKYGQRMRKERDTYRAKAEAFDVLEQNGWLVDPCWAEETRYWQIEDRRDRILSSAPTLLEAIQAAKEGS